MLSWLKRTWTSEPAIKNKDSHSLVPIVHFSLKRRVHSGRLPFIWFFPLICSSLEEVKESSGQRLQIRQHVWVRRGHLLILYQQFERRSRRSRRYIIVLRLQLLRGMQMRPGACESITRTECQTAPMFWLNGRTFERRWKRSDKGPVLLAGGRRSLAHMTEVLRKCQGYEAYTKEFFFFSYGEAEIRKDSLTGFWLIGLLTSSRRVGQATPRRKRLERLCHDERRLSRSQLKYYVCPDLI